MRYFFTYIALICLNIQSLDAQILNRILDRTQDKLSREISNKIVEKISDEITRAAMKPIDKAVDDMFREKYTQDSIAGKTNARNYNDYIATFVTQVDLPEQFEFDLTLKAETKDYDGEKSNMDMLLTKDGSLIGIVQYEENKKNTIVIDMNNDIMAIYSDDKDGKKVTAVPSMLSMAANMNYTPVDDGDDDEKYEVTIKKSGKTKKVVGYACDEWEIDDEATTTKCLIANEFPVSWKDSFGQFLKQMMPTTQRQEMPQGMVLKSETKTKKKNKKSSFVTKKVIDAPTAIVNSEYEQISYSTEE
ncbi:MAG: hypothetical protein P1U56_09350 [Saprospiraceae bacterium]|nr:hypothetical protein [Saprospiraceae bacterium]